MCEKGQFIDSIEFVKKELKKEIDQEFKNSLIIDVLKKDLKMRYRKIKAVALTANSRLNLIMHQQFALEFFKIDLSKKVVLNIDETWLGMSDFRRTKWALPNSTNSVAQLQIVPRISMIACLDSNGQVFFSLV